MPSPWDHRADKHLLMVIILDGQPGHMNWSAVSDKMAQKGYSFTAEACRQHYQKIRKEYSLGTGDAPAAKTPTRVTKTKSAPSSRGKRTPHASFSATNGATNGVGRGRGGASDDDDDDADSPASPDSPSLRRAPGAPLKGPSSDHGGGFAGQTAAQFKLEGEPRVNLDDDSLYV